MAITGPPPQETRRRRNADPYQDMATELETQDAPRLPDMPPAPDGASWHPDTVTFFHTMRDSAQAKLWTSTDWWYLIDTVKIYERWTRTESETGYVNLERAIRARCTNMGVTYGDRLRLRIKAPVNPAPGTGVPATTRAGSGHQRDTSRFIVHEGGTA
jgi:hypothetical protein